MEISHIDTTKLTRGPLEVTIVEVESPSSFWVRLTNSREDFIELLEDMEYKMSRKYQTHTVFFPKPGLLVAVKAESKPHYTGLIPEERMPWNRGMVEEVNGEETTVLLKDWGRRITVPTFELYLLPDQFKLLSWKAIHCGIWGIAPAFGEDWVQGTKNLFAALTMRNEGQITIRRPIGDTEALVDLSIPDIDGYEDVGRRLLKKKTNCNEHHR